jgi:NAD(P)-dependent dehydrogenase (short-subunit alcohol dehydrogenase family)
MNVVPRDDPNAKNTDAAPDRTAEYPEMRATCAALLVLLAHPALAEAAAARHWPKRVTTPYSTARWLIRGIGSELLTNIAGRGGVEWQRAFRPGGLRTPAGRAGDIAVVTGATGGIGQEICRGLAASGYHVILAARDCVKGKALERSIRSSGGSATFVEVHLDSPVGAAKNVAAAVGSRPCALLVNNAGVMSVAKREIMNVNLIGTATLTVGLLPSLRRHPSPRLVNVGSSSHLRARFVDPSTLTRQEPDADLSAYAQSKLGLMLFSTLLRSALPWLEVCDAHPGIVWTPMLQRHWGKLAPTLERSGLARLLFKSPSSGATTILTAAHAPRTPPAEWGERSRWSRGWKRGPYFVNGRPGGFASRESRSLEAAERIWKDIIEPVASEAAPDGCELLVLPETRHIVRSHARQGHEY